MGEAVKPLRIGAIDLRRELSRDVLEQIRFFIREGLDKHLPLIGEQPRTRDCSIPPDIEEIIRKSASGKKLDNIESDKLKNYFNIDD